MTIGSEGAPHGSLAQARAHWVTRDTILWDVVGSPKYTYSVFHSADAALVLTPAGIDGGTEIPLALSNPGPGGPGFEKYPHLAGCPVFKLDQAVLPRVPDLLKGQLAVLARDGDGHMADAAALQIPGVVDDLFHYTGPLGVTWQGDLPIKTSGLWRRARRIRRFATGTFGRTRNRLALTAGTRGRMAITTSPSSRNTCLT